MVTIAHRLDTIKDYDRIVVLDQGTVSEDGTWESLVKKGGHFKDLVAHY